VLLHVGVVVLKLASSMSEKLQRLPPSYAIPPSLPQSARTSPCFIAWLRSAGPPGTHFLTRISPFDDVVKTMPSPPVSDDAVAPEEQVEGNEVAGNEMSHNELEESSCGSWDECCFCSLFGLLQGDGIENISTAA
jgi:hypothetical protein